MAKRKNEKGKKATDQENEDFFEKIGDDGEPANDLAQLDNQPEWIDEESEEGQLSVDVFEDGSNIIVKSTIAGVEPDDIDVSIVNDMLTIRGERKMEKSQQGKEYFFQECYWGAFSRSIILPVEVETKKIDATIKNGILTVILPKANTVDAKKNIPVKDHNE